MLEPWKPAFNASGSVTVTVNALLTHEAGRQVNLCAPGDVLKTLAGLSNSGGISANHGSSIDAPFVNNLGTVNIDATSQLVVGTPRPMGSQSFKRGGRRTEGWQCWGVRTQRCGGGTSREAGVPSFKGTLPVAYYTSYSRVLPRHRSIHAWYDVSKSKN